MFDTREELEVVSLLVFLQDAKGFSPSLPVKCMVDF